MWSRAQLKDKAKAALKRNYWKLVLVSAIVLFLGGGGTTSSSSTSYSESFSEGFEQGFEQGYNGSADDYDDYYNDYSDSLFEDEFALEGEDVAYAIITVFLMVAGVLLVVFAIAFVIAFVLQALIFNPFDVGCKRFYFKNLNEKANVREIAFAFDSNYKNVVKTLFFRDLYVFLWSLLFIIPGIVKSYEYRMMPYLLAENPSLPKEQAFAISKQMMDGQKWDAFVLDLSFFGWNILSVFTMGLLSIFYVAPYQNMTNAALYESLCYQRQWTANQRNMNYTPYAQQPVAPMAAPQVSQPAETEPAAAEPVVENVVTETVNNNTEEI